MLGAQRIYGPDAVSQWDDGFISIGRALFRLLPEDVHDCQPLVGGAGKFALVADVRLDNREDLFVALELSTERGRDLCDAAVLLSAFERWGEACLDRIVGDFAFAIWNSEQRELLLARDPLGQRPLHYYHDNRTFAFASMPKGLHAIPEIIRAPDVERVAEFVVLLPETGTRSYFNGVHRVEPGHVVTVGSKGISSRRYWEPKRGTTSFTNAGDYAEGMRYHVDLAVRARLRGVTEAVATHLSAGLDSSIITTTAAQQMASRGGRAVAFTSVPREGKPIDSRGGLILDEGPHASATAAVHPNIEHILIRDARSPLADLDRYFYLFEQPVRDLPNGTWFCAINDAARERGLKIMLPGYLGNFSLSYNGFQFLPELIGSGRLLRWTREFTAAVARGHLTWRTALSLSVGPYVPTTFWVWINQTFRNRALDVTTYTGINPRRLEELQLRERARASDLDFSYPPRKDGFTTRIWALRRVDMGNILKGTLGGWGIDQRDPTTDRRLVEFCLGVPTEQFLSGGIPRSLARRAFADRVPGIVLNERLRGRQGSDWYEGVRPEQTQISNEIARLDDCAEAAQTLDLPRLHGLVNSWPETGWEREDIELSYRIVLLRALASGHFLRKATGSNR
jgi:asparagine synthase (glutamine-hydrolysing)